MFKWFFAGLLVCGLLTLSKSFSPPLGFISPSYAQSDDDNVVPQKETAEQMRKRLAEEKRKLEAIQSKKKGVNKQVKQLDRERARLNKLLIDYAKRIQKVRPI